MQEWLKDMKEDETTRQTDKKVIASGKTTEQAFNKLIELNLETRIVGFYSYDVVDHPDFEICNKMEKKIQRFYIKTEKKKNKKRKSQ